jgi:hypothetical protein
MPTQGVCYSCCKSAACSRYSDISAWLSSPVFTMQHLLILHTCNYNVKGEHTVWPQNAGEGGMKRGLCRFLLFCSLSRPVATSAAQHTAQKKCATAGPCQVAVSLPMLVHQLTLLSQTKPPA